MANIRNLATRSPGKTYISLLKQYEIRMESDVARKAMWDMLSEHPEDIVNPQR
jgi:hypothetical protein